MKRGISLISRYPTHFSISHSFLDKYKQRVSREVAGGGAPGVGAGRLPGVAAYGRLTGVGAGRLPGMVTYVG